MDSIFDSSYYRLQSGLDFDDAQAVLHFQTQGDALGLDPNACFSTVWYKNRYPKWSRRGAQTAVEDFLRRSEKGEDRQPHPLIDPAFYRATYPDLADLGGRAALHFIALGDDEGRRPSAGFDTDFYQRCYLRPGQNGALRHYVTAGKALGHLPRPLPRNRAQSALAMRQAITALRTTGMRPILLVCHDAQAAGVPILTLDLARALRARSYAPIFLLGNAGPLTARFQELGPVFVQSEGWDTTGLAEGLPKGTRALINTGAAAGMAVPLAKFGLECLLLIHEMPDYLREQSFLQPLRAARDAGARLVASMPLMAKALEPEFGALNVVTPGIVLPPTPLAAFVQRRKSRGHGPVFIGAGYADRRKGFDRFIEAAEAIAGQSPRARFVWLGALDAWAQSLADAAKVRGLNLTLPGFVDDSLAWYRGADVYLLTSRQDPGPTTVIHAAAVGTPFVGYAADIGLIGLTEGIGQFLPVAQQANFAALALDMAAGVTAASRRRLRRLIRQKTDFARYVDTLDKLLTASLTTAAT
ncbi:glycosyl transferase [Cypionkella aquatica]|uniref:Glycosyl transferase n=1 Tax=Cypionkella aquatica TaxID=1756042 RepID=A0AA37U7F1_9RHOB|nr:glycosyl transferase [Cypionkella aquatica]GLS88674.1 glycosyl transferase [Cypionkella aquatica]